MSETIQVEPVLDMGPLLRGLVEAQRRDAAFASQVQLRRAANALSTYALELRLPWLEPVSDAGHRLVGAALVLDANLRVRTGRTSVRGSRLLLVDGVAVGPLALVAHAHRMRTAGAASVHGFAVDLLFPEPYDEGLEGLRLMSASGRLPGCMTS
jgi:hypothetical protein